MALQTRITNAAAIAACDAIVDLIDAGAGTATAKIYDGTQPAGADVAITSQNELASFDLPNPAFGAAGDAAPGGQATAQGLTLTDASATATGTASWFRVVDRDGNAVFDGSVGTSDADMILNTVSIVAGAQVDITAWTVTMPES